MAEVKYVSKDKLLYFYQGLKNIFAKKSDIPTKTSDLTNDSNYVADANYNTFTSAEKEKLAGIEAGANATAAYDTEISSTSVNAVQNTVIASALNGKVDAETGKGLSTNDLTDELVATINSTAQTVEGLTATGGEANVINAITYSTNGGTKTTASISNKTADIDITVPTKVSDLNNDEGYQTNISRLPTSQAKRIPPTRLPPLPPLPPTLSIHLLRPSGVSPPPRPTAPPLSRDTASQTHTLRPRSTMLSTRPSAPSTASISTRTTQPWKPSLRPLVRLGPSISSPTAVPGTTSMMSISGSRARRPSRRSVRPR